MVPRPLLVRRTGDGDDRCFSWAGVPAPRGHVAEPLRAGGRARTLSGLASRRSESGCEQGLCATDRNGIPVLLLPRQARPGSSLSPIPVPGWHETGPIADGDGIRGSPREARPWREVPRARRLRAPCRRGRRDAETRFAQSSDQRGLPPIAFASRSRPACANVHMLVSRSALPVSSVITSSTGPATARQQWPASSP